MLIYRKSHIAALATFALALSAHLPFVTDARNADACSFAVQGACFESRGQLGATAPPAAPILRAVTIETTEYRDGWGGCWGGGSSSCSGSAYTSLNIIIDDLNYDDRDRLEDLGVRLFVSGDAAAVRYVEDLIANTEYNYDSGRCFDDETLGWDGQSWPYQGLAELSVTSSAPPQFSSNATQVRAALVDQNGNVSGLSEPVYLDVDRRVTR